MSLVSQLLLDEDLRSKKEVIYEKNNFHPHLYERFSKKYIQVTTTKTFFDYLHDLEDDKTVCRGRIGGGISSIVVGLKDSENVIKLISLNAVRTEYDKCFLDPYLRFIHEASFYPKNPLFPKIVSVKMCLPVNDKSTPYAVVEMERLNRFNSKALKVARYTYDAIRFSLQVGQNIEAVKATAKAICAGTEAIHIIEAVEVLQRISETGLPYYSDLHVDNVMVRGKDQLVITDPFMYEEETV